METFFALLVICAGIHRSPVTQRPVTRSFDVFFDLCLNKQLDKQSCSWWFETLSRSLWRHCNGLSAYPELSLVCDLMDSWSHRKSQMIMALSGNFTIVLHWCQELCTRFSLFCVLLWLDTDNPDSKVHGTSVGPIWGRQDQGGPHFSPMNFAIWQIIPTSSSITLLALWQSYCSDNEWV